MEMETTEQYSIVNQYIKIYITPGVQLYFLQPTVQSEIFNMQTIFIAILRLPF